MEYETKITKSANGWQAKTEILLETFSEGGKTCERVLLIRTAKSYDGQVCSNANVCVNTPQDGYDSQIHTIFRDYAKTIACRALPRVTEKAIREAHAAALESVPSVIEEARANNWKAIR